MFKWSNQKGASSMFLVVALVVLLVVLIVLFITDEGPKKNTLIVETNHLSGDLQDQITAARRVALGERFSASEGEMIVLEGVSEEVRFEITSFTLEREVEYELFIDGQEAAEDAGYSVEILSINPAEVMAEVIINE